MKNFVLHSLALWLLCSNIALAQSAWITDDLATEMHSGPGREYRIIDYLKAGEALTLLQQDEETGYSQVRTSGDREGWVMSTKVMASKPLALQLAEANATIAKLTGSGQPLQQKLLELEQSNSELSQQRDQLASSNSELVQQLDKIRETSAQALQLERSNRELLERTQMLQNEIDVLQADNERLADSSDLDWFINGALAVGFGVFLAVVIPSLRPKRKRSEWL